MPFLKGTNRGCRFQDLTGIRFGQLSVLRLDKIEDGRSWWLCKCDCGVELSVRSNNLKQKTKSCGCRNYRKCRQGKFRQGKHGLSKSVEYRTWITMLQRCLDENCKSYSRYGGRGITVCERWLLFENFFADMGMRPSKRHSIDRIDNEKGYGPDNCRWATQKEQTRNTRRNRHLVLNGITKTLAEWEELTGISHVTITARIDRHGWDVERALTTPIRPHKEYERKAV